MAAKNVYANINELIKDYYSQPVADYLNQTVTVNEVSLDCDIYRVANNSELTASVFTGCTAVDANTQIIIGSNLSIADGTTLTPPYRCKGIIIGCPGTFTNAGTISMTARGASGAGIDIPLVGEHKISATGGTGGTAVVSDGNNYNVGHAGSSPASSVISCGGGGSGACNSGTSGAGGVGTCFSGGAGGGAMCNGVDNATDGSSTGGAGGNGSAGNYYVVARSGAGNPVGTETTQGYSSQYTQYFDTNGTGTGGLIILMANFIVNTGSIVSEGSKGPGYPGGGSPRSVMGGGASGGGCICLVSESSSLTGTISTAGGTQSDVTGGSTYNIKGGAGGAGTYANLTVEGLVLVDPTELQLGLTVKSALDNIEPVSGRLMGLIDDDELMYEYQGTRHRAMNTDVDLSVIHAPGTAHNATDGSPVGTIISFFGYTAPSGYLVCDGTEYTKADYPYLATHLADLDDHYSTTQYVGSDSDHFKVPDLRGEFLRGTGTNSHENQGNGANVGVHQDATELMLPSVNLSTGATYISAQNDNMGYDKADTSFNKSNPKLSSFSTTPQSSSTGTWTVTTSRPTNTSVLYCIKYN